MNLDKYYYQRFSLFSKFDEGILLDDESWYSVTPEAIAKHIAQRCKTNTIIDAFCGAGGNAIQFALTCKNVIAIDIDPEKIRLAKNNARIYNVLDKITFVIGDSMKLITQFKADVVFLSPPWGGPEYLSQKIFDIRTMPVDGIELFNLASKVTINIVYYLPRTTSSSQVIELAGNNNVCELEKTFLNARHKCLTIYYGNLINQDLRNQDQI